MLHTVRTRSQQQHAKSPTEAVSKGYIQHDSSYRTLSERQNCSEGGRLKAAGVKGRGRVTTEGFQEGRSFGRGVMLVTVGLHRFIQVKFTECTINQHRSISLCEDFKNREKKSEAHFHTSKNKAMP